MKKFVISVLSLVFLSSFSSVLFGSEFVIKAGSNSLDGGEFFKGYQIDPKIPCTSIFNKKQESVAYEKFFDIGKIIDINVEIEGKAANFKARVVLPEIYASTTFKYKILPNFVHGPDYDTNVIISNAKDEQSLVEKVVFIQDQTSQLGSEMLYSNGPSFDTIRAKYTLNLSGFYYIMNIDPKFLDLCEENDIPFIRTTDNKLLVPVGGDSSTGLKWVLARFFGIK